jgi:hypothetical protein
LHAELQLKKNIEFMKAAAMVMFLGLQDEEWRILRQVEVTSAHA